MYEDRGLDWVEPCCGGTARPGFGLIFIKPDGQSVEHTRAENELKGAARGH
jgi:hypothetical protein